MAHDFKNFPELTNAEMDFYYFESPHKQIFENFFAKVIQVHDGDTIRVTCDFRDFDFPIRLLRIDAPELKDSGGEEARLHMEKRTLNQEVVVEINPKKRVDKYGRLLGEIIMGGVNMGDELMRLGFAQPFEARQHGKMPDLDKIIPEFTKEK